MAEDEDSLIRARHRMVDAVEADARAWGGHTGRPELSPAVLSALGAVPRHRFVPPERRGDAYANHPLPIGRGQTISQPAIVGLMTDLLDLAPVDRVLEIGTGCGYQTAVLARLAAEVFSIETVPELAAGAADRLAGLGVVNVRLRTADGALGWPEAAPFDGVMVTAAPKRIPRPLIDQLAPGGRLVVPLGDPWERQWLTLGRKAADGRFTTRAVLPVAFVPLV